jgi:hypothetical protein
MRTHLHVITVAVAASYVTLGFSNPDSARSLWKLYAVVMLALAVTNLVLDRRVN